MMGKGNGPRKRRRGGGRGRGDALAVGDEGVPASLDANARALVPVQLAALEAALGALAHDEDAIIPSVEDP